ncbi:DUF1194 domain-containing protein [Yoonia sp.]|uniref:DUF1194 domain-containing protein n=1 Tax=Yoonia sp. TaxID=2212373 RepID=UPI003F6AD241
MIRLAVLLALLGSAAEAACRHALALGLDISGSVDADEYRQQLDGLATAMNSPAVQDVLFAQSAAPVRISVYEWSGPEDQHIILPWTDLSTPADLANATATLRNHQRPKATLTTAIGSALLAGFNLLEGQNDCWKRTLDLSGDGPANTGPRPQDIGDSLMPGGVTVNGLVIGSDVRAGSDAAFETIKDLSAYYSNYVLRGPDAFVETAHSFADYAVAMERKLLRELQSMAIGQAGSGTVSEPARTPPQ